MPDGTPEQPWPLSPDALQREATTELAKLLQVYPEREGDLGDPENLSNFIKAYGFYRAQGFPKVEVGSHLKGIDFNGPVETIQMPPPDKLAQWQIPDVKTGLPRVGCYWTIPRASSARSLGISPKGPRYDSEKGRPSSTKMMERTEYTFTCPDDTPPIPVLRTKSAPIIDDWTDRSSPRAVYGGGTQHFSKRLGQYFQLQLTGDYKLGKESQRDKENVVPTEAQGQETHPGVATSKEAMDNVLQKLKMAKSAILTRAKDSDPSLLSAQLKILAQEAKKAANEAISVATDMQLALDAQPGGGTLDQKKQAARALYFAYIAENNLEKVENLFAQWDKMNKKDLGSSPALAKMQSKDVLPSIPSSQPRVAHESSVTRQEMRKKDVIPSIASHKPKAQHEPTTSGQEMKRNTLLAPLVGPIASTAKSKETQKFRAQLKEGRTEEENKNPNSITSPHKSTY